MMYPILYPKNAEPSTLGSSYNLGLGVLDEAREIKVIEELNSSFTLTLLYPVTGQHYKSIERGCLLMSKSNPYSTPQLFRIQQITRPMNGIIEIYATHKSYDLSGYVLKPCNYLNVAQMFADLNNKLIGDTPIPWTWWTDKSVAKSFVTTVPMSLRSALAGNDESVLKIYGGEFEFDNNTIKLHDHRGANRGVTIRYGVNLVDFKQEEMFEQCYTHVLPFWSKEIYDEENSTPENSVYTQQTVIPQNPVVAQGGWGQVKLPDELSADYMCYGEDKFVVIPYRGNKAVYSYDGITWYSSLLPDNTTWGGICYGNGLFLAVGTYTDLAAYSHDGISWTRVRLPSNSSWGAVCYGNGKFISFVYNANKVAWSLDCVVWHEETLPSSGAWDSACYGNGVYVGIARGANSKVAYSSNGVSWTVSALPVNESWHSVCFGNGKFVTVGYNSNKALYSVNGITWVEGHMPSTSGWQAACYGGGKFISLSGSYDCKIATSADGIVWTQTQFINGLTWMAICYGSDKFVTICEDGKAAYTIPPDRMKVLTVDLTSSFEDDVLPTVEQLETVTQQYILENHIGEPDVKMTVNFVDLAKTTEYQNLSSEIIKLGDIINVLFEQYGINTTAEVIKTTYDPLKDSYSEIELGNKISDISTTLQGLSAPKFEEIKSSMNQRQEMFEKAVAHATDMITSSKGGQILLHVTDDSGKPSELLILSRDDEVPVTIDNAVNVWRWNQNGLAFSSTGYAGPYRAFAVTKDGHIVADTINLSTANITGELSAGNIDADSLTVQKARATDFIEVVDENDHAIFKADAVNKIVTMDAANIINLTADQIEAGTIDADVVSVRDAFALKMDVDGEETIVGYVGAATGSYTDSEGTYHTSYGAALKSPDGDSYVIVTNAGVRLQYGSTSFYVANNGVHYSINGGEDTSIGYAIFS